MKALKFLNAGARGPYSGFEWPVPNGNPGRWVAARGKLIACENGIHACTLEQAPGWIRPEVYVIELAGAVREEQDKLVARRGRLLYRLDAWDRVAMVRFAADCPEHVLPIFEEAHSGDARPRNAVSAARAWADCPCQRHRKAAYAYAARAADAHAAAYDARAGARAADAAARVAHAAADAAAYAADATVYAKERAWQSRRLRHYLELPKDWDK